MLYEVIGNPLASPSIRGAVQDTVTQLAVTDVVGATGVEGLVAHNIETGWLSSLYPNAFKDFTLKL